MKVDPDKIASSVWITLIGRASSIIMPPLFIIVGKLILDMQHEQAKMTVRLEVLANTVQYAMSGVYKSDDATRDFKLRDLRIEILETRLRDIEHDAQTTKVQVQQQQDRPKR